MRKEVAEMGNGEVVSAATMDDQFKARCSEVFASELYKPLLALAGSRPDDVLDLIAEFRESLDLLEAVIGRCAVSDSPGKGRDVAGGTSSEGRLNGTEGVLQAAREAVEDVGRNQRSRLRELAVLEYLSREARAFTLQQVLNELSAKGFSGCTEGAVVSQLHRLKKTGAINQPANGMYEITDGGLSHMRKLRTSFGSLVSEGR